MRSPGQILFVIAVKSEFLKKVNSGLEELGIVNRSHFIRQAIAEKLGKNGRKIKPELVTSYPRGRKPRKRRATAASK